MAAVAKAGWPARPAVLLLFILLLSGCSVTLIAPYDRITDEGLMTLYGRFDELLATLDADPVPPYAAALYRPTAAELRVLQLRNDARAHNAGMIGQLGGVARLLTNLEAEHRAGELVRPMLPTLRRIVDRAFLNAITDEIERKRLTP